MQNYNNNSGVNRSQQQPFTYSAANMSHSEGTSGPQLRRPKGQMNGPMAQLTECTNAMTLNDAQTGQYYGGGDVGLNPNTNNTHWQAAESKAPASVSESKLNPNARDFIPRSYQPSGCIPNGTTMWSNYTETHEPEDTSIPLTRDVDDYIALSYLREFIDAISLKPNKYETGIGYLTDVMNSYIDEDEIVMPSAVNTIVDQAILDPQFRYNGVRLCINFMENLRELSPETSFKNLLFQRCQREHSRRGDLVNGGSANGENYLRGLTLFIGDLYSRCAAPQLAEYLPPLLQTLVAHPNKENLKCVCQVLKLCGSTLEAFYREKKSNEIEAVMEQLALCTNKSEVGVYTKELITSIIEMQKRGWTTVLPSTTAATSVVNPYLNPSYAEQSSSNAAGDYFEEYNSYSDEEDFNTSYDFGSCGDEEDHDVCEAFEEFLRNSGQTK